MPRPFLTIALASLLLVPSFVPNFAAAVDSSLDAYVGQQPEALLKAKPEFAKAYRSAVGELDFPAWTQRLAAGKRAERVDINGTGYILTSACSSAGCLDEHLYILFDPQSGRASGLFYLPPASDNPGDTRTAFSRWYGMPADKATAQAIGAFLLERAATDAQTLANPVKQ
ncbi:hypothetical protein E4Q23_18585 [Candidatus Accumulibacter phosphatis]|jgi:hypothetical protein|uniref:C-lysozyme inhibitor n=1 Tax=Candidatus Accumulibacter phosphatis TaxID=327160 RepID=A0ABX1U331_9PROT|nr:Ivy family c-type lysozyme inhibitor [Candidatus Accumulibacter phosphatis]NMQ29602.1 hypothetical protein [Candidatus Accumulibacter phosphatis]